MKIVFKFITFFLHTWDDNFTIAFPLNTIISSNATK